MYRPHHHNRQKKQLHHIQYSNSEVVGAARLTHSDLAAFDGPDLSFPALGMDVELFKHVAEAIEYGGEVISLDLRSNCLGDAGASAIASFLATQGSGKNMRKINVARNGIGDEGATALLRALTHLPGFISLDLSGNPITDASVCELQKFIAAMPRTLEQINLLDTHLSFHGAAAVAATVVQSPSLIYASLPYTVGHSILAEVQQAMLRNAKRHGLLPASSSLLEGERKGGCSGAQTTAVDHHCSSSAPAEMTHRRITERSTQEQLQRKLISGWADEKERPALLFLSLLDAKCAAKKDTPVSFLGSFLPPITIRDTKSGV